MSAQLLGYRRPAPNSQAFQDLSAVRLTHSASTDDGVEVPEGTEGTVVGIWAEGAAYEVDCSRPRHGRGASARSRYVSRMTVARLEINQAKLDACWLDLTHKDGGSKAKFFSPEAHEEQRSSFSGRARATRIAHWPGGIITNLYGTKHRIVGPLQCPDGSAPTILVVWQVHSGTHLATLVTAYPNG